MQIHILDSTLCEGTRNGTVSFSVDEKLILARELDRFGVDYIEAGWPALEPNDRRFFDCARQLELHHSILTAFGCLTGLDDEADLELLINAGTPAVTLHVDTLSIACRRVEEAVRRLKSYGREVILNAGDFFRAFYQCHESAFHVLEAARSAGAGVLCLCVTSGTTLPNQIAEVCHEVRRRFGGILGIRASNNADVAVANTLAAVELGFTHVQGTINGYGERCGCANLCSLLPNLELKLGHSTVGPQRLKDMTRLAHVVAEFANLAVPPERPYVGHLAFSRDPGRRWQRLFPEAPGSDVPAEAVGNHPFVYRIDQYQFHDEALRGMEEQIALLDEEDYDVKAADGTLELLIHQAVNPELRPFEVIYWEVSTHKPPAAKAQTSASVSVRAGDSILSAKAEGDGPIHALDQCLRECLASIYPAILEVRLTDYKVRVLEPRKGTAAKVRVLTEWSNGEHDWVTIGISENVLEASWRALADGIALEIWRAAERGQTTPATVTDSSWAV
ncbi:MAG: alpha-isopropylmalate synthase regulatory domain-containing protein [Bryobacteraceae bacterium]